MKKHTLLYLIIIVLVAANTYFVYNQFGGKQKRGHKRSHKGPVEFIVKKLDFSDDQVHILDEMNKSHREKIGPLLKSSRQLKESLFNHVSDETVNERKVDSILKEMSAKEIEKEAEMFFHLRAIRDICDDKQKEKFNGIIKDVMHRRRGRLDVSNSNHKK